MMTELSVKLGFRHDNPTPYYPQANGQVEAMPTYVKYEKITTLFLFNHIISRFRIPRAIVTDHGSRFQNKMMADLSAKLWFSDGNSTKLLSSGQWPV